MLSPFLSGVFIARVCAAGIRVTIGLEVSPKGASALIGFGWHPVIAITPSKVIKHTRIRMSTSFTPVGL
jgi:hypothetical protein